MRSLAVLVLAASVALAAGDSLSLGGITLGGSVLDAVHAFGPPDKVATSDAGHEWRWYDAKGADRAVLTDDALTIHEVLVARPLPVDRKPSPLVQPDDVPVLEATLAQADAFLGARGAVPVRQANQAARAWRWHGAIFAADVVSGKLMRLRALDEGAASRLGYVRGVLPAYSYRAPRFARIASVGYPRSAADAGAHGVVVVRVDVDASGNASRVMVLVSTAHRELDDAEIDSMRRSKFIPAYCDAQPCPGILLDREEFVP